MHSLLPQAQRLTCMAHVDVERLAYNILEQHATEVAKVRSKLVSLINRLRAMDLEGCRRKVREFVHWIEREAHAMESAEKNAAISKAAGGGAAILGGAMAGLGIIGSVFTFGLTAPLAMAGLAVRGAGAATSVGSNAARLSVAHMKTCEMKRRCESFEQRSASIVGALRELSEAMSTLRLLFQQQLKQQVQKQSAQYINSSAVYGLVLGEAGEKVAGLDAHRVALVVDDLALLQKRISTNFGSEILKRFDAESSVKEICGSVAHDVMWKSAAGAGLSGMGDVKEAAVTLQSGGSQAKLMRADATTFRHTVKEIEDALHKLDLM